METGNTCCSLCTTREAQCFCICQFPLPALCSSAECTETHVHKKSAGFHYLLPTSANYCVTARNHLSVLQWIVALHHKQSKLIASLSLLEDTTARIEESYQREVIALTALKDKYLARVNQFKEAATEAFRSAVKETTDNAINSGYVPQSDITHWIWTMASQAEDDDTPLFHSEVSEIAEEEIGLLFAMRVNSTFQSLERWHVDYPRGMHRVPKEELERLKSTALALDRRAEEAEKVIRNLSEEVKTCRNQSELLLAQVIEKNPIQDPVNSKMQSQPSDKPSELSNLRRDLRHENPPVNRKSLSVDRRNAIQIQADKPLVSIPYSMDRSNSKCKTCGSVFIAATESLACANFCQCSVCFIQSIFSSSYTGSCPYCQVSFDRQMGNYVRSLKEKCHACGLVLDLSEIVEKATCKVCIHCIIIYTKNRVFMIPKIVGVCSLCKNEEFSLRQKDARLGKMQRACCENESQGNFQLTCGHYACESHMKWLKQCRACHQPIRR